MQRGGGSRARRKSAKRKRGDALLLFIDAVLADAGQLRVNHSSLSKTREVRQQLADSKQRRLAF
jgi:hypothetical protein